MATRRITAASCAFLGLLIVLGACRQEPPAAAAATGQEQATILGLAGVERIEPVLLESYPVQLRVLVHGWLPDGCTSLKGFDQKVEGNVISMRVLTERPREAMCTQAIKRFQETYPVEIEGLAPGAYTLNVNGKTAQVTLP